MRESRLCPRCDLLALENLRTHSFCWECNYSPTTDPWRKRLYQFHPVLIALAVVLSSAPAHASVESSLIGLKIVLLGSVLPVFAVIALGFAAFSFFTGNPNAKQHLVYAITGAVILFGAQSIVDLLQRVVR